MTVRELKDILDLVKDTAPVEVLVYSCGSESKIALDKEDLKITPESLLIDASYN